MELLHDEAPLDEFEKRVLAAHRTGVTGSGLERVESAARMGLRLQAQSQRRRRREAGLSALIDTARELAMPNDLDTLLQILTRRARLLLGVDMAYVSLLDPADPGGHAVIRAADGHTSTLSIGLRLPAVGGLGNAVVADRAPFSTRDYLHDDRIRHDERIDEVVRAEGLGAMMAVPLCYRTGASGTLYVAERKVRQFTADERSVLGSLGDLAGAAIEIVRRTDKAAAELAVAEAEASAAKVELAEAKEVAYAQQQQIELVLDSGDLQALLDQARRRLDGALRVLAADSTVLASAGSIPDCDEAKVMSAMMSAHTEREPIRLDCGLWVVPILAGADHLGVVLHWPERPVRSREHELLRTVAHTAAVVLHQGDRSASAQDLMATDDLLDELLAGKGRSPKQVGQRAARLGVDLSRPHVVVVAKPAVTVNGKVGVWASSYVQRRGGLKTIRDGAAVLLLPGDDPGGAARAVADELSPLLNVSVTAGSAGPAAGQATVPDVYQEAQRCLDAMTALGVVGGGSSPTELGFLGALLSDNQDMDGFIAATIGPVIEHDREKPSDLVRTLDEYFATGCSPTRAAERLHVHPNTVTRRLERVGELLPAGWQEPERALDVHLALRLVRIRQVIDDKRGTETV